MLQKQTLIAAALAIVSVAGIATARAECLSDAQVKALADNWLAKTPAANPEGQSEQDAACSRAKFTAVLAQSQGPLVGYKAGLTNPAVQKRFNANEPVWGKLYQNMILQSGAEVAAAFGARPLFEADMLVRVKSAAINQASTPMEVLENIDQIIPFIELLDLVVEASPKLNGTAITAINVGARLGIAGQPIAAPLLRAERYAMLDALRDMQITLADGNGAVLGQGKGSDILGHPLSAVVYLTQALAKEGLALQPGQLISLGSFSPLLPPKAGLKVNATFSGLPGAQPVTVTFK
jgi:2-keto-4-pentenoate hydratase